MSEDAKPVSSSLAWCRKNPERTMFKNLRTNNLARQAKGRRLAFELTYEEFLEIVAPMRCSKTGIELRWGGGPWAPSVDRVDNTVGYTRANVRLVCWLYNRALGAFSEDDLLTMARALVEKE